MSKFSIDQSFLSALLGKEVEGFRLEFGDDLFGSDQQFSRERDAIDFDGETLGYLSTHLSQEEAKELAGRMAPHLYLEKKAGLGDYSKELFNWVMGAKKLEDKVCDWIGIYYKANHFLGHKSTDLFLGAYFGEYTDHQVIPLERGLCGLALREERVVNVADVHQDDRHIACSLKTKSELIIPLLSPQGEMIAELDIDCNQLNAFSSDIEERLKEYCKSFPYFK